MFSKRPDVVTARVSVAYWKKQVRMAFEIKDNNRLQKCSKKLMEWEDILHSKKAEFYQNKPTNQRHLPAMRIRQLPAAADAPRIQEWVPQPLRWD